MFCKPQIFLHEEAKTLSTSITQMGSPTPGRAASAAIQKRNQMLHLLKQRVDQIRSAARYVYRNHPEIRKQSTSNYERRRRLAARRKQKAAAQQTEQ